VRFLVAVFEFHGAAWSTTAGAICRHLVLCQTPNTPRAAVTMAVSPFDLVVTGRQIPLAAQVVAPGAEGTVLLTFALPRQAVQC
jgi:hypothetical protein